VRPHTTGNDFAGNAAYDGHRLTIRISDPESGLEGFLAVHRGGVAKPAFGATRMYAYPTSQAALCDALKLSRIMTYKSALAGLPYGGAKAVIFPPVNGVTRRKYLARYAGFINMFGGHVITGADAGLTQEDVGLMSKISGCIMGVTSDPVGFTLLGLLAACEVCLNEVFGKPTFAGRTVAVSGLGKTGLGLVAAIHNDAKEIFIADIDRARLESVKRLYPSVRIADHTKIDSLPVDVFAPCALSDAVNEKNVRTIKAAIIVGSANGQLSDPALGSTLYKRGILYAPDYVVNAGGLIAVCDEYEHKGHDRARVTKKVDRIRHTLKSLIAESKKLHEAPNIISDRIAAERAVSFA
jgi:leucine dehydrogenase